MRGLPVLWLPLLSVPLGGCADGILEYWYKGTTKGVTICQNRAAGQSLAKETVRSICVRKHQKQIADELEGKAGYRGGQPYKGPVSFSGSVTNKSHSVVVTQYSIWVSHIDAPGERTTESFSDRWIEPNYSNSFSIDNEKLNYPPKESENQKDKFMWSTTDVYGIDISF